MIVDVNTTIAARSFADFDVGDCFIDKDGDLYLKAFQKNGCVAVNLNSAEVIPPTMFDGEVLTPIILKVVNAN